MSATLSANSWEMYSICVGATIKTSLVMFAGFRRRGVLGVRMCPPLCILFSDISVVLYQINRRIANAGVFLFFPCRGDFLPQGTCLLSGRHYIIKYLDHRVQNCYTNRDKDKDLVC